MKLKKYTKSSLIILITIILSYWVVSAWTNLTTVTAGTTLTDTLWNDIITQVNETWNRVSWIFTDWSNNVWIWTITPSTKLEVSWPFIRTIAHASANWPNDDTDSWQIISRVLNFTKTQAGTDIRIWYTDARRVYSSVYEAKNCRWEIKVDWASCTQPLVLWSL